MEGTKQDFVRATMHISQWTSDGEQYFTCLFSDPVRIPALPLDRPGNGQTPQLTPSSSSGFLTSSINRGAADTTQLKHTFPPVDALNHLDSSAFSTNLSKVIRLRDTMMDAVPMLAIWKDETLALPNRAMMHLMQNPIGSMTYGYNELLSRLEFFNGDFSRKLKADEYPTTRLCRTQRPFKNRQVGLKLADGALRSFDLSGECINDEKTGGFIAGLLVFKDVTQYRDMIRVQNEQNEEQFQLVCNSLPQLLWTTDPKGNHDWFSRRWYEYTGSSAEESLGEGWRSSFHPDDLVNANQKWSHSLETGEEYCVEYRCRRHDGNMRWMLGLAAPLRDSKSGEIQKWFGSCKS